MMNIQIPTILAIICLSSITFCEGQLWDPYVEGPYDVVSFTWNNTEYDFEKHIDLWAPKNGKGPFPVVYFSGSLAGTISVRTVETFLTRVASHGYAILAPWQLGNPNYTVEWIDPVLDFAEENFVSYMIAEGADPEVQLDFSRMVVMGHSAGNHITVNYLKRKGCRNFVTQILLSPVDGVDPFGLIRDEMCIEDGVLLHYEMPTLVVKAGLDPIPGTIVNPACAPANLSNERFYYAMPGNRWFINATDYGHVDFFEQDFVDFVDAINFCATETETDKEVYRDFTAGTVVAFMAATLNPEKDCAMLAYVEAPEVFNIDAFAMNDVNVETRCEPAKCIWTDPEEELYDDWF